MNLTSFHIIRDFNSDQYFHCVIMSSPAPALIYLPFLFNHLLPFHLFFVLLSFLPLSPPASSHHMVSGCRFRRAMRGLTFDLVCFFLCRAEGRVLLKSRQTREYRFPLQPGLKTLSHLLSFSTHSIDWRSFQKCLKVHKLVMCSYRSEITVIF